MVRLLHSSDWQLGARVLQGGDRSGELRQERLATAGRIVELARAEGVDALILAGDIFDRHDVDESVLRVAVELLESLAPVPVLVLPGNHDPWVEGGVWRRRTWRRVGDHVRLLNRSEPFELEPGVTFYPCPLTQKSSNQDPTAWIPVRREGDVGVRIGIAHGSFGEAGPAPNFPIDPARPERAGLDYLALGDWHSLKLGAHWAYPGTPEATSFAEREPGHVLLVDIDEQQPVESRRPALLACSVGRFSWSERALSAVDATDIDTLANELRALGDLGDQVLRLRVELVDPSAETLDAATALERELEERAFFLDWQLSELYDAVDSAMPDGVLSRIDEYLALLLARSAPPLSEEPKVDLTDLSDEVLREARAQMRRLVRESEGTPGR